jgi:DNA-binding transcriptional LysR family regulator
MYPGHSSVNIDRITVVNISTLDLNLFRVFQAVLEEGSTVRAAKRLSVTQSAVSNALARLRHAVGDPLFVRSGRGLVPTPRAEEMRPAVTEALCKLDGVLGDSFDPKTTTRSFAIAGSDHHQAADIPRLARSFMKRMPKAQLHVVSVDYLLSSDGLANGTVDAVIAPDGSAGPGLHSTPLFRESSGLYVRAGHPALGPRLSLKDLEGLGHIDVHLTLGKAGDTNRAVSSKLMELGFARRIDVITPSFGTAAMIAAATDCVAWLPTHAARLYQRLLGLRELRSVLPAFNVGCSLLWHQRTVADPGAAYFRDVVVRTLREAPPRVGKGRGEQLE